MQTKVRELSYTAVKNYRIEIKTIDNNWSLKGAQLFYMLAEVICLDLK